MKLDLRLIRAWELWTRARVAGLPTCPPPSAPLGKHLRYNKFCESVFLWLWSGSDIDNNDFRCHGTDRGSVQEYLEQLPPLVCSDWPGVGASISAWSPSRPPFPYPGHTRNTNTNRDTNLYFWLPDFIFVHKILGPGNSNFFILSSFFVLQTIFFSWPFYRFMKILVHLQDNSTLNAGLQRGSSRLQGQFFSNWLC